MTEPEQVHTYGPKCRLAAVERPWPPDEEDVPPILAQYFYCSPLSVDDPLSPHIVAGSVDSKTIRGPLRPFSDGDNNALERAWLTIADEKHCHRHRKALKATAGQEHTDLSTKDAELVSQIVNTLTEKHSAAHASDKASRPETPTNAPATIPDAQITACCPDLASDVEEQLSRLFCPLVRGFYPSLENSHVLQDIMVRVEAPAVEELANMCLRAQSLPSIVSSSDKDSMDIRKRLGRDLVNIQSPPNSSSPFSRLSTPLTVTVRPATVDAGVTGKPFARMYSTNQGQNSASSSLRQADSTARPGTREKRYSQCSIAESKIESKPLTSAAMDFGKGAFKRSRQDCAKAEIEVPVGVSRLHMVSLPSLQMKPIYWSPVNDITAVLRATWFYSETMVPVDPIVSNYLEAGYRELRPHSETWQDELRCAVEVGPLGEEKVVHMLWPKSRMKDGSDPEPTISHDPTCAARCFRGEASAEGQIEGPSLKEAQTSPRQFSNYQVVYKDEKFAFLLKPSLRPSAYYNRKPVARIFRGHSVGIPVQRGFDRLTWQQIQSNKKGGSQRPSTQSKCAAAKGSENSGAAVCLACKLEKEKSQVTDLVLIAHGIGQKFAERVESFHFTHAINAFRREINIELGNPAVKSVLREGHNGIMVLPVNWRHALSFEDGGPMREEDNAKNLAERFSLKDIEPTSIPAIRSLISDVMFDIPFYMSHHKRKMIETMVTEANRVYRLWCRNNPGFAENGRVHLIGHSLGSAMALEVLSNQPTRVPRLDLDATQPLCSFFEFDTKNLFLLGSPAGFFLLLERGALMPRRGRVKPGVDPSDTVAKDVVGEAGVFGCLAVDNVYNILAKEDPIAYLLTGTIDPTYAASLKVVYVPSATSSLFKTMGDAARKLVPGLARTTNYSQAVMSTPTTAKLPSQLELEVHDFTREEIAEKKAYLLNDNGQVDYYLQSSGGPLEIQYLNMLSAHTSYWVKQDLIRMICMEIGREPGRQNTLPWLRVQKNRRRIAATLMNHH